MIASRVGVIGASIIGVTQVASALAHIELFRCPFVRFLGIDCPGCGLSRASAAMFQGRFTEMLHLHAFAPLFMIALLCAVVGLALPSTYRLMWAAWITRVEQAVPLAPSLLLLLIVYWLFKSLLAIV